MDSLLTQFRVTDKPPKWSRSNLSVREKDQGTVKVPAKGPYFYIDADLSWGWPRRREVALCKLGVTSKHPVVRCQENEETLWQAWDIEADLEVVFVATGDITVAEKEIVDHTLPWLPSRFRKSSEWRRCPPRELARIALLIAERQRRSSTVNEKTTGDRNVEASTTQQARHRRLNVPGTTVHLEPVPTGEEMPAGQENPDNKEKFDSGGRPLREPMPGAGPFPAPSRQGYPQQRSPRQGPQAELFPSEDLSSEPLSGPGGLLAGEVPSKTGLAQQWLRQRALFAELRALEKNDASRIDASGEQAEISRIQDGKSELGRGKRLSLRLKPVQAALLNEAVACSCYRGRSALLRATATGRDRRAPIIAKAGMLFFWVWRYFGEELGEEGSLAEERPREAREALQALSSFLFGLRQVGEALALIRRHLHTAELINKGKLAGEGGLSESLPAVPETVQKQVSADPEFTASVRVSQQRYRLIEENADYSTLGSKSAYLRHMALGWDRNAEVRAQCSTIAEWMTSCLGHSAKDAAGKEAPTVQISPKDWTRLDRVFRQRFDVFLAGPRPTRETDVEGALRKGTKHLLGAGPETFAIWAPAEL